jgi:HEAT repeat protein
MTSESEKIKHELEKIGIRVSNIYDLVNTRQAYPEAIPVLIGLLQQGIADKRLHEGVVRALAVKEAKGLAGPALIADYLKIPKEELSLRWATGSSMEVVATGSDVDDILRIVQEQENGRSRQMFVLTLGKFRSESVEETLFELLKDDDVALHAIKALRKQRSKRAIPAIENLFSHKNKIVRELAKETVEFLMKKQ